MELYLKETSKLLDHVTFKNARDCLKDILEFHFEAPGKLNRPKTVGMLTTAYDIQPLKSLGWAAALEMFHNGTLIHDDLQDGDILRRGRPAVWKKYGANLAINAGDYLMLNAYECIRLSQLDEEKKLELSQLFAQLSSQVVDGQCREFKLNQLESIKGLGDRYMECARLKTASLFGKLARGVGIIGDLPEDELEAMEEMFLKLGILFQLQDDILDLYGDKNRDMQGNDIKEGKVSFLIVKHLELHHYNFEMVKKLLRRHRSNILRGEILIIKEQFLRDGTLSAALSELVDRSHALLNAEEVVDRPEVQRVLQILISDLLKPLQHLGELQNGFAEGLSNVMAGH